MELVDRPTSAAITLPLLEENAALHVNDPKANTFGVKSRPQWQTDPIFFIIPVLHIMMGLVNKALQELNTWIDNNIEMVSDIEQIQRNKVTQLESTFLQNTQTYLDESTILEQSRSELLLEWRELIQILKDADIQRRNKTLSETPEVVDGWKARKDECKNLASIKKTELDVLKKAHKKEQAQLKTEKDLLIKMRKVRLLDNDGFDTELEAILGLVAKIYKEAYHGGDLNGVCCIRLLDKQKEVISSIKEMCI